MPPSMPPWVMVPGTLCTGDCFGPLLDELGPLGLRPRAATFVPGDLPGSVDTARALLREAPRRFVICGFSLGGIVALQAALAEPSRIAAMILVGTNGRADPPENAARRRAQVETARGAGAAALIRDGLWPSYVAAGAHDDAALRRSIETMAEATSIERFANQTEIAIGRPDALPRLARLDMPVLLLGGAEDRATPPERTAELAAGLPRAHRAIIEGAGHFVLMERPARSARAIADWWRRDDVGDAGEPRAGREDVDGLTGAPAPGLPAGTRSRPRASRGSAP